MEDKDKTIEDLQAKIEALEEIITNLQEQDPESDIGFTEEEIIKDAFGMDE